MKSILIIGVGLQLLCHAWYAHMSYQAHSELLSPPPLSVLKIMSLGEPTVLSKWLMLWLQTYDDQAQLHISFKDLNYFKIIAWLSMFLILDPHSQYPLLSASHLYMAVDNSDQQKLMLNFVYQKFLTDPEHRWPWLAHGVLIARHRLHDISLAKKYADALQRYATSPEIPHWVSQMGIFIRIDMNEKESAKILLGALLKSGTITDPHELYFLESQWKLLKTF